jgi:hypothetical protein
MRFLFVIPAKAGIQIACGIYQVALGPHPSRFAR